MLRAFTTSNTVVVVVAVADDDEHSRSLRATMSRRESRASMGARQNDALSEFENCTSYLRSDSCSHLISPIVKKKFLLANKHITKCAARYILSTTLLINILRLNSTLSSKIEELNAQISTLYVENLRLRASEIALTSQLKRERAKSQKIMSDADSAVCR